MQNTEQLSKEEGLFAMIDLKNDLPDEWYAWKQTGSAGDQFIMQLKKIEDFLPFYARKNTSIKYPIVTVVIETKAASPNMQLNTESPIPFRPIDGNQIEEIKILSAEIQVLASTAGSLNINNPDSGNKILKAWAVARFTV